jgi:hypothetical protein
VTTPVWAVQLEGKLYVVTSKSTGKTRRVRATGRVRFAPCNANGRRILGEWQEATGRIVQDEAPQRSSGGLAAQVRLATISRDVGLPVAWALSRTRDAGTDAVARELTSATISPLPPPARCPGPRRKFVHSLSTFPQLSTGAEIDGVMRLGGWGPQKATVCRSSASTSIKVLLLERGACAKQGTHTHLI